MVVKKQLHTIPRLLRVYDDHGNKVFISVEFISHLLVYTFIRRVLYNNIGFGLSFKN